MRRAPAVSAGRVHVQRVSKRWLILLAALLLLSLGSSLLWGMSGSREITLRKLSHQLQVREKQQGLRATERLQTNAGEFIATPPAPVADGELTRCRIEGHRTLFSRPDQLRECEAAPADARLSASPAGSLLSGLLAAGWPFLLVIPLRGWARGTGSGRVRTGARRGWPEGREERGLPRERKKGASLIRSARGSQSPSSPPGGRELNSLPPLLMDGQGEEVQAEEEQENILVGQAITQLAEKASRDPAWQSPALAQALSAILRSWEEGQQASCVHPAALGWFTEQRGAQAREVREWRPLQVSGQSLIILLTFLGSAGEWKAYWQLERTPESELGWTVSGAQEQAE